MEVEQTGSDHLFSAICGMMADTMARPGPYAVANAAALCHCVRGEDTAPSLGFYGSRG